MQALLDDITGAAEGWLFRHGYGDSHAHVGMPVPYGAEARALEAQLWASIGGVRSGDQNAHLPRKASLVLAAAVLVTIVRQGRMREPDPARGKRASGCRSQYA